MMVKGRNTKVIGVRLSDEVIEVLEKKAKWMGYSVGEYIKAQILKSVRLNNGK